MNGRPPSLGGSHAKVMFSQICSGWKIGGVPGRGESTNRSANGCPRLSRQRLRRRASNVEFFGRFAHADTRAGQEDDSGTHDQALWRLALPHDSFETVAMFRRQIDAEHLAEELEDMGKREKRALRSRTLVLLAHLLN